MGRRKPAAAAVVSEAPAVFEPLAPQYLRDHPAYGSGVQQRIYAFDDTRGATTHMKDGYWYIQPIKFTGLEITSFDNDGQPIIVQRSDDMQHTLHNLKGA